MGKYIVTVSGTDRKSEIISETYHVSKFDESIKQGCIEIFEAEWINYSPINITVSVVDIEKMFNTFKPDDGLEERIKHIIYRKQRKRSDEIFDTLTNKLGRTPTHDELINELRRVCDETV